MLLLWWWLRWLWLVVMMIVSILLLVVMMMILLLLRWRLMMVVVVIVVVLMRVVEHLWLAHWLHVVVDHWDTGQRGLPVVGVPAAKREKERDETSANRGNRKAYLRWSRLWTLVVGKLDVGQLVRRVLVHEARDGIVVLPHARADSCLRDGALCAVLADLHRSSSGGRRTR